MKKSLMATVSLEMMMILFEDVVLIYSLDSNISLHI